MTSAQVDAGREAEASRLTLVVNSLLWALGVVVLLVVVAALTQIGAWGLWVGVLLALALMVVIAVVMGARWHRAGAATVACVLGFVALLFAGPTTYEAYMWRFGEPQPAVVIKVYESNDVRHCVVLETTGDNAAHDLDQRQNCFDHISDEQHVTIDKDPFGMLPPRLEDSPDQTSLGAAVIASAALVGVVGGVVLYGGLRRRAAPPEPSAPVVRNVTKRLKEDEEVPVPHAVWLDRRSTRIRTGSRGQGYPTDDAGPATWQIGVTDAAKPAKRTFFRLLAYPEREPPPGATLGDYRKASKNGMRRFVLWADPGLRDVSARVTTTQAARRRAARYEILDPSGQLLATVERRPGRLLLLRRTRWTVQQVGRAPVVGRKGRLAWWVVWWATLPFQIILLVVSVIAWIASFFAGDAISPVRPPRHTRWRLDGQPVLDHRAGRGEADRLHVLVDWWDPRVTAALVALTRSHDGWLGNRWDRVE